MKKFEFYDNYKDDHVNNFLLLIMFGCLKFPRTFQKTFEHMKLSEIFEKIDWKKSNLISENNALEVLMEKFLNGEKQSFGDDVYTELDKEYLLRIKVSRKSVLYGILETIMILLVFLVFIVMFTTFYINSFYRIITSIIFLCSSFSLFVIINKYNSIFDRDYLKKNKKFSKHSKYKSKRLFLFLPVENKWCIEFLSNERYKILDDIENNIKPEILENENLKSEIASILSCDISSEEYIENNENLKMVFENFEWFKNDYPKLCNIKIQIDGGIQKKCVIEYVDKDKLKWNLSAACLIYYFVNRLGNQAGYASQEKTEMLANLFVDNKEHKFTKKNLQVTYHNIIQYCEKEPKDYKYLEEILKI